jgi:phosphoribosyl-ATP pyrophosphohydrolase/phosphoribosyl-AMP cyclohydrolase
MNDILQNAKFGADGLIPAVVQDARTREVLTVAYMNQEALQRTIERGETWFWREFAESGESASGLR